MNIKTKSVGQPNKGNVQLLLRCRPADAKWAKARAKLSGKTIGEYLGVMRTIVEGIEVRKGAIHSRAEKKRERVK